jgi:sugar phosphate isomerase/epimerase
MIARISPRALKRGRASLRRPMRLGISSYTYGWAVGAGATRHAGAMTAIDLIDQAARMGVRVLQIADNLPDGAYTEASVNAIAAHAKQAGVAVELGTRGCAPEHLRRFIGLARRLGSPILRVVTDKGDDEPSEGEVIDRFAAVADNCRQAGVVIAIENHDRLKSQALARIAAALPAHVGICLDTVNSFGALEGPEVVVETLGPYAVNLHLKDFAVVRYPSMFGFRIEGRPAGQGMLDVPWLLGKLRSFGRDCNAILELWPLQQATQEESIRLEAEWALVSVRALRQWIPD